MYLCDYEHTYHRKPFKNEETSQLFSSRAGAARPKQNVAFFMQWATSLTPHCHLAVCAGSPGKSEDVAYLTVSGQEG